MTYLEARDTMFAVLKTVVTPYGYQIEWPDVPKSNPPDTMWIRVHLIHAAGGQDSLSNATGAILRYRKGFLLFQVYSPKGRNVVENYTFCQALTDAYDKENSAIIYRNARIREIGLDGEFNQINVYVNFEYEHLT